MIKLKNILTEATEGISPLSSVDELINNINQYCKNNWSIVNNKFIYLYRGYGKNTPTVQYPTHSWLFNPRDSYRVCSINPSNIGHHYCGFW